MSSVGFAKRRLGAREALGLFGVLAVVFIIGVSLVERAMGNEDGGFSEIVGQSVSDIPRDDVLIISKEEYRAFLAAGNWLSVSPKKERRREARARRQDKKDLKTIEAYARKNGLRVTDLVPPDPQPDDETTLPSLDGNFIHRILLRNRTEKEVITYGRRWFLRTVANNIRTFPTRDNQFRLYQGLYEGLPDRWRSQLALPHPDEVRGDSAARLLGLNKSIANPEIAPTVIQDIMAESPPPPIPPGFLTDCHQEMGAGNGGDRYPLTCTETPGSGGIVVNYDWNLKPYITCIKAQAGRGTCTGFANTSAIEMLVWKTHGVRVNLSEQGYYNRARTKWDNPSNFGDGHTSLIGFQKMQEEGFLLYFEDQWSYNPALSRKADEVNQSYSNSCVGYSETCSDTVHQSQFACVEMKIGVPIKVCGYFVPEKNPNNEGYRIGDSAAVWDKADKPSSLTWMLYHLAMGRPLVMGHPVITAWDLAAGGDGFMPYPAPDLCTGVELCPDAPQGPIAICECYKNRGGHGTHIVGWIDNTTLQQKVPSAPPGDGGGYFIVKNSWSNCAGDGGFIYAPFQSIVDHAADVTVLYSVQ